MVGEKNKGRALICMKMNHQDTQNNSNFIDNLATTGFSRTTLLDDAVLQAVSFNAL